MWTAITRDISRSLGQCELSFVSRSPIDVALAATQHQAYRQALIRLGCRVLALPAEDALPDAVFVEDTAIVLDELAVLTRPGAESRRGEVASVATALRQHRTLVFAIEAPGTLDGGDVLRLGRAIHVGESARSNSAGIGQLRALLQPFGYSVSAVRTRECLHLKSAVTQLDDDTVLLQPAWVDREVFAGLRVIEIDPQEPHAANVLRIGDGLLMPASFPRTHQRLLDAGFKVDAVDVSQLQKAEGAVTCCSLVFRDPA
jgi:dimethylargininase